MGKRECLSLMQYNRMDDFHLKCQRSKRFCIYHFPTFFIASNALAFLVYTVHVVEIEFRQMLEERFVCIRTVLIVDSVGGNKIVHVSSPYALRHE